MDELLQADPGLASSVTQAQHDFVALSLGRERQRALGLFLRHLALGERVAQRITLRQVALAPDRPAVRVHRAQARHETLHARLFDLFAAGLSAPPLVVERGPYDVFEERVAAALARGDYLETIAATQIAWSCGLLCWVVRFFFRPRPRLYRTPVDYALLGFFILTFISSLLSYEQNVSIGKLRGASLFTIVYLGAR